LKWQTGKINFHKIQLLQIGLSPPIIIIY